MSKSNQTPVAAAVVAYALAANVTANVATQGKALAAADSTFANALEAVARGIGLVLGLTPSYDHWEAVAGAFQAAYIAARKCNPETARKRWFAVCAVFEMEKPAKPTVAGAVKAEQRTKAKDEAAALIAKARATTPAAVLALSQAGVKGPVIAALAKVAGEMAADAGKAANEAAKAAAAGMREEIRKSLTNLTNDQLSQVRALVQSFAPKPVAAVISPAAAAVGLESLIAAGEPATTE